MHNEGILKTMADEQDKVVLSFHDSLLHDSDVFLLNEGQWLNDNLIGFMFEYFEHEEFKGACDIVFISPNVSQFIKLGDVPYCEGVTCLGISQSCENYSRSDFVYGPEVGIFLEPLDFPKHKLLFFVINDNESKTSTGGSHWSLLTYNRETNSFVHYDSFHGNNNDAARSIAKNIQPFLSSDKYNVDGHPPFVNGNCPQQQNGCDCGVYVICITEHLCKEYLGLTSIPLTHAVSASTVSEKRRKIKNLIFQLASSD